MNQIRSHPRPLMILLDLGEDGEEEELGQTPHHHLQISVTT